MPRSSTDSLLNSDTEGFAWGVSAPKLLQSKPSAGAYELLDDQPSQRPQQQQTKSELQERLDKVEADYRDLHDRWELLRAQEAARNAADMAKLRSPSFENKPDHASRHLSDMLTSARRAWAAAVRATEGANGETQPQRGPGMLTRGGSLRHRHRLVIGSTDVSVELPQLINEEDWVKYTADAKTPSGLLFPVGAWKFRWDLLMLSLIIYSAVTVPFRLGMDHSAEGGWWIFEVLVSLCFLTDIYLNFMTAYLDGDQFVLDRSMIAQNYFRGWFLLDLSSSIPLELIDVLVQFFSSDSSSGGSGLRMLRALRLVRLLRLLRLLKIQTYINLLEDMLAINMAFLSLVKLVFLIMYITHIMGCSWYYLAASAMAEDALAQTWLIEYADGRGVDADVWTRYLFSFYWALTTLTTVGYGDITPTNDVERCFALLAFLIGALVFGYMILSVDSMVRNADPNAVKIEKKLDEVKVYLRWHKFPTALALRVRRYYEFYFSRKSAMDEEEIVRNLAPTLRRAAQAHLVHRTVMRIPLFSSDRKYSTLDLQLEVYHMLTPLLREAKEVIIESLEKGADGGPSVYFARRGTLVAKGDLPDSEFYDVDATAEPGVIVGEHCLMSTARCHVNYVAKTRCELFALGIDDLQKITSALMADQVDEMAELISGTYAERALLRAAGIRNLLRSVLVFQVFLNKKATSKDTDAARLMAALRIQSAWTARTAKRAPTLPLRTLLPALYSKTFRGSDAISSNSGYGAAGRTVGEKLSSLQAQLEKVEQRLSTMPSASDITEAVERSVANAMERMQGTEERDLRCP